MTFLIVLNPFSALQSCVFLIFTSFYVSPLFPGCRTGEAKLTKGFNLAARFIIHTVGPKYKSRYRTAAESSLYSCYRNVLQLAKYGLFPHTVKDVPHCGNQTLKGSDVSSQRVWLNFILIWLSNNTVDLTCKFIGGWERCWLVFWVCLWILYVDNCFLSGYREQSMSSVGFCVINSAKRGYPLEDATHIALRK